MNHDAVISKLLAQAPLAASPRTPHVGPQTRLREDLGLDSVALISLFFSLEEEFSIDVEAQAARFAKCQTVGDVARALIDALEQRHAE